MLDMSNPFIYVIRLVIIFMERISPDIFIIEFHELRN